MNPYGYGYGFDLSLLEYGLSDEIAESLASESLTSLSSNPKRSPPRLRHDGTSPLPLGMDWSPAPRKWDGQDTIWPHDPHTGWSYCVTIPSWTILSNSRGSDPVVFYRVQIGIQTPEAITTTRGLLCRFSDFLKLYSELKKSFPRKKLPLPPPRKLLGTKSRRLIEERRSSLEDWMQKLLSDIDISRSAPVAIFLELEAAIRSSFSDSSGNKISLSPESQPSSDISAIVDSSSVASDYVHDCDFEQPEFGKPRHGGHTLPEFSTEDSSLDTDLTAGAEITGRYAVPNRDAITQIGDLSETTSRFSQDTKPCKEANGITNKDKSHEGTSKATFDDEVGKDILSGGEDCRVTAHIRRLSTDSARNVLNSIKASGNSNWGKSGTYDEGDLNLFEGTEGSSEDLQFPSNLVLGFPSDQRCKFNRVLATMQQRLTTAKADMEDLVARLNQELAVRQYLTTKVKDLEVELENTKENTKDNLHQAVSIERERFTQMQWDVEELRKKCLDMELKLKAEKDEKTNLESVNLAVIQENEMLKNELDAAREKLENLQKCHEESELKTKTDVKVLVKEVKSLRSSQSELKEELSKLVKEKLQVEKVLDKEKQRREHARSVNKKLLHECKILQERLQDCSVNFLVEEDDKLVLDSSSPSDVMDLLNTSDNRIGLLLAEAQLLAQDVESSVAIEDRTTEDELRKMLTDIFVDDAIVRKQINSVIRCALNRLTKCEKDDQEEEVPSRKTVLGKFL